MSEPKQYQAYAPFECKGQQYNPGDIFSPPAGWVEDDKLKDTMEMTNKRRGTPFAYTVIRGRGRDTKTGEAYDIIDSKSAVLPVEEIE